MSLPAGREQNYPLQFGRAFAKGEIRGTPKVLLDGLDTTPSQADVKTRHDDGSVRFAVISIVLPTLDTNERVLSFADAAQSASAPLKISAMLTDFDFEAGIRVAGTSGELPGSPVSARAMLAALTDTTLAAETAAGGSGPRYWTQGPVCTTVLLHDHATKAYDLGSNATRAIRPLFIVQFWPGIQRYHVRHVFEVADVTKLKEETGLQIAFTTGLATPAVRLSQSGVNLFTGSFASRAFWGGAQLPRANVKHNLAYLASTGVVPNFDSRITINAASLSSYANDWATRDKGLGAVGYWQKTMSAPGGRPDLGLFPKWDVLALYSGAAHMHEIAESHAELAGWWNMHYREGGATKTIVPGINGRGRVISKMTGGRPTHTWAPAFPSAEDRFTIDGTTSGRDGWGADNAHTPGLYFFQYLTTGSAFWHEKLLQLGSFQLFHVNPGLSYNSVGNGRASSDMVLNGVQPRGFAWAMRDRGRAWWVALDESPERTLFSRSVEDALAQRSGLYDVPGSMVGNPIRDAWNARHMEWWASIEGGVVTQPRPNPMSWTQPGTYRAGTDGTPLPADAYGSDALWMQNYSIVSLYHIVELGYGAARLLAEWYAKPTLEIANSSEPRHLADYIIPSTKLDGRFYQSAEAIWTTYAHNADSAIPAVMGSNPAEGFSAAGTVNTYTVNVEGYGSLSAGAIAMASGAPGASTAWLVVKPWYDGTRYYGHDPRWAILPR